MAAGPQCETAKGSTATTATTTSSRATISKGDEALQALEAAKKRLERISKMPRKALKDMGNDKEYTRRPSVGDWSAQAQVDEILRQAKERTSKYKPAARAVR